MSEKKKNSNDMPFLVKIFGGKTFVEKVLMRNLDIILYALLLVFIYMGNRYVCEKMMLDIRKTNQSVKEYKFKNLTV